MIQSCLKKAIAVVLFVFAVAVFANPADYLPANAQIYGGINMSSVMRTPLFKKYMPAINQTLEKETGFKIQDLNGTLVFAVDFGKYQGKLAANLTVVCEFNQPIAAQFFQKATQNETSGKLGRINGKRAWENKDFRFIQQSNKVLILQGHMEGKKPYPRLGGNNPFKAQPQMLQQQAVLFANMKDIFPIIKDMAGQDMAPVIEQFEKVMVVMVVANIQQNSDLAINAALICKNKQEAAQLTQFIKSLLNQVIQKNPDMRPILSKFTPIHTNQIVSFKLSIDPATIEQTLGK